MTGTLRSLSFDLRKSMREAIDRIVTLCPEAMRGRGEIVWEDGMPPLVNDDVVVDQIVEAAKKTIGADHVITVENPSMGSEDFSCLFPEFGPGAQFSIGSGNDDPDSRIGLHNSQNVFDEGSIAAGTAVLVQFVRDYLTA